MSHSEKLIPKKRFKEFRNTEGWEQCKVKDVCEISTGKSNTQDRIKDGIYPFYVRSPIIERSNRYLYDEEAVLTVGDGVGTGKVYHYVNGKYDLHQRVYRMFDFKNGVLAKYFYHHFSNHFYDRVMAMTAKTSVDSVRYEMISEMSIEMPSEKEQAKIIDYLDDLDNLITLQQRKLEKMKALKKSYLSEMFPAKGEYIPKRRFTEFTDAWEQCKLSGLCSMHARIGWQNLRTSEFLDSGEYYLVTGTDFEDGHINFKTCHYIDKKRYDQDRKIQLTNGSILITKDGTLGKVAYVEGLDKPATLNAGVFNVTISSENVDEKYLFQYLKAPFLMDYVSSKATGGTIKHLNQNILVDFPVLLPKIEEQREIGMFFQSLDNLIAFQQKKLDKLQNIKKAYLNEMFV